MFHIIYRPPYDDYTFSLFTSLYLKRKQYGLGDAEFIYLSTSFMSLEDGITIGTNFRIENNLMRWYFLKNENLRKIIGHNRYFNTVDEVFEDFMRVMGNAPECDRSLYGEFVKTFNHIHANIMNRKQTEYKLENIIEKSDCIVLFIKDHFRVKLDTSWTQPIPEFSEYFANMCEFYHNKKFVIVTSLENLDKEISAPNCTIITMGGDITNQSDRLNEYRLCLDKNFIGKNFISLNRGRRNHRTYLVSALSVCTLWVQLE